MKVGMQNEKLSYKKPINGFPMFKEILQMRKMRKMMFDLMIVFL